VIGVDCRPKKIKDARRRAGVAAEGADGDGGDAVVEDLDEAVV
jgi:hypothetical protein